MVLQMWETELNGWTSEHNVKDNSDSTKYVMKKTNLRIKWKCVMSGNDTIKQTSTVLGGV